MRLIAWSMAAFCCPLWVLQASAAAQDVPRAFVGAKLITIEGTEIDSGTLVIEKGKITAVGPAAEVTIPAGAEKVDVSGKIIMPGLICTHSHIGGMRTARAPPTAADPSSPACAFSTLSTFTTRASSVRWPAD